MPEPIRRGHRPRPVPDASDTLGQALLQLSERLAKPQACLKDPEALKDYLRLHLAGEPNEVFAVLFLDQYLRVLAFEVLFQGSVRNVPVFPREVIRRALHHNAAALVVAHNHPAGEVKPSHADLQINQHLLDVCKLFDIRLIDSLIVGGDHRMRVYSAAAAGWK